MRNSNHPLTQNKPYIFSSGSLRLHIPRSATVIPGSRQSTAVFSRCRCVIEAKVARLFRISCPGQLSVVQGQLAKVNVRWPIYLLLRINSFCTVRRLQYRSALMSARRSMSFAPRRKHVSVIASLENTSKTVQGTSARAKVSPRAIRPAICKIQITTVNTRYRHTFGTPKTCNVSKRFPRFRRYRHICQRP